MNVKEIARVVASAMPPTLAAAQSRMVEVTAESSALSARLSRIAERLAGNVFPMRTDVREALEAERRELSRQFPELLGERTRLQREINTWRPVFDQNLRSRLAPALTGVAIRIHERSPISRAHSTRPRSCRRLSTPPAGSYRQSFGRSICEPLRRSAQLLSPQMFRRIICIARSTA